MENMQILALLKNKLEKHFNWWYMQKASLALHNLGKLISLLWKVEGNSWGFYVVVQGKGICQLPSSNCGNLQEKEEDWKGSYVGCWELTVKNKVRLWKL